MAHDNTMKTLFILVVFCISCIGMKAQPAVGSVKGALTVNDMGAAVYSMTFDAPNGGRMTPTVGLAYNSQSSGYGLAGYGIDVTGISVITSGGRDMFHNGKVRGAKYDSDCNLYLDGKRLVLQEGEDGMDGAVYSPEGDPHTKVTLHYGVENCGASYFSVSTNDGTTYSYGNYSDSKLRTRVGSNDRVAAWYICEARNKYGESIQYKYTGSLRLVPSEITYGGTDRGIRAKIEFTYKAMASGNERPFHIGNWSGTNSSLLSSVTTSINGQTYRRYDFTYDETASDKFSRLTTITESNGAGECLNPTELTWNVTTETEDIVHTVKSISTSDGTNNETGESSYLCVDLNGDAVGDIIRLCSGKINSVLRTCMYVSNSVTLPDGTTKYESPIQYFLPGGYEWNDAKCVLGAMNVMDHDGDGLNDLLLPSVQDGLILRLSIIYGENISNGRNYHSTLEIPLSTYGDTPLFATLDMNGDGRDNIFYLEKSPRNGWYKASCLDYDKVYGPFISEASGTVDCRHDFSFTLSSNPARMFTGDYNGDGLPDLIVVCENGYKILFNNGYTEEVGLEGVFSDLNSYASTYSNSPFYTGIKNCWRMEQGDFDGDGLVDFFCYDKDTGQFHIVYNNGDGTFRKQTFADNWGVYDDSDTENDNNRFSLIVTDFDNDGKSDVMMSKAMYAKRKPYNTYDYQNTLVRWLHSTGNGLELTRSYEFTGEKESYEGKIFTGDFDGDGRLETANVGPRLDQDKSPAASNAFHIYKNGCADAAKGRLSCIRDGFGNTDSIFYKYYSRPYYYEKTRVKYPVNEYFLPLPLVSSITSKERNEKYDYGNLLLHVGGRGVLGFSNTSKFDKVFNILESTYITQWDEKRWIPSKTERSLWYGDLRKTQLTSMEYKTYNVGNDNWTTQLSKKTHTDLDGNIVKGSYSFDAQKGTMTSATESYDETGQMYKSVYDTEYVSTMSGWLPQARRKIQKNAESSSSFSNVTRYGYDKFGNILSETPFSNTKTGVQTTCRTYDRWGNVTSETFRGNDESTGYKYYEYDPTGRFLVKTYTVPESTTTTYTYDVFGNVLTETDETNASNPLTTMHEYDTWGRRKHTVYPDGTETIYYTDWDNDDNIGNWFSEERHTGAPWTRVTYDSHGREIATTTVGPNYINIEKNTEYNEKGQVSKITNIYGKRTTTETFTYDARGRVLTDTHSSGASTTYEYGRNTVYVTDAAGRTTMKTYDPWGNVKTVTDNEGNIVEYQYGSHGNPVNVTTGDVTVTMEYDELGRRTKLVDPDAGTITTTYGRNGQVISETDGRGVKTTYTYDALGRVTQRKREDTTNKWVDPSITSYTYGTSGNSKGRIVKKDCDGKAVSYEYDMYGRVTRESRGMAYNHDYTYDELRKTYTYDSYGRLATVTYPASHSSKGITIGYRYDSNGNVTKVLFDNRLDNCLSRNYSDDGLRREIRSDYLGKTVIDYDNDGYPVSKSYEYINSKNNRGISDALSFSWDKTTGNLLSKTINGKTETYSYDNLDRLTGVSVDGIQTMKMEYAGNGNIESKTGIGEYTYYDGDRPHAVREVENVDGIIDNREVSTQYALNGKVTSIWNKDYTAYSWYEYGPDDEKWSSWGWTPDDMGLEWDVDRVYWGDYERLTKDYHIREYYFLDNDVFLIRENSYADSDGPYSWNENFYQMERDNIGNIVAIYDLFHRKVFEAEYDAWGKQTVIKDDICFNHGFTGHEMLPGFDLIHMDGRVYDPTIGRFLSPDNYVQLPENSQSFNRYSYCFNNPLKYIDPDGQWAFWDDLVAMVSGGIVNLVCNIENLVNPLHAVCSFAVGAAAGEATLYCGPMAGAAISGVGNSCVNQLFQNGEINFAQVLGDGMISMGCSYLGNQLGSKFSSQIDKLFKGISSNVIRDAISNATCNSVVGLGLGGAASFLDSETSFLEGALHGAYIGFISGAITGVAQGISENRLESTVRLRENLEAYDEKPYSNSRPSYGKGQVKEVWENAKGPDGIVRDPHTGEVITWDETKPRNGQWDMGHTEENKYSDFHKIYMQGGMTKDEFLKWYRNPLHYRPELPKINRSHRFERIINLK